MNPTILVTGATGTAGRFVLPALRRLGFEVRGQYNKCPGPCPDVDWRQMNFFESLDFSSMVAGCDAVVHLAAESTNIARMGRVNVDTTRALVTAAKSAGVRYFGHASSIVVYGSPRQRNVDEATALLDPYAPVASQYNAEPYMREYARTKTLAEFTIREAQPTFNVDLYRPTIIADFDRLLEAGGWRSFRKLHSAYRRTQYIYAPDVAAAVAHLVARGLTTESRDKQVEAYNICDQDCGTFGELLGVAHMATGDPRYKVSAHIPVVLDLMNNIVKYRRQALRYPLGMVMFSNAKLLGTGFKFPVGFKSALTQALCQRA
jgi:nucleoside-diphosphate-sugar epimerase